MFGVFNSLKDKVQAGVAKVSTVVQAQLSDLMEEQQELAKEEQLDEQRKKDAHLPWEGIRNANSTVNGSITDIIRDDILELSQNESSFLIKEEDFIYEFPFNLEDYKYQAIKIQDYDKNLGEMRRSLVPKKLSDEQFWKNYFYQVEIIKMKHNVNATASQSPAGVTDSSDPFAPSNDIELSIRNEEDNI